MQLLLQQGLDADEQLALGRVLRGRRGAGARYHHVVGAFGGIAVALHFG